jgi:hypothetical protein
MVNCFSYVTAMRARFLSIFLLPMETSGRRYLCARCRTAVLICSHCDRGQRYCSGDCARLVRVNSMRLAGQRYQTSLAGRYKHAARQSDYRARQTKVTHQGSPPQTSSDLLPAIPTLCVESASPLPWHCHFCGELQSQFVRQSFLRCRIRRPLRKSDRRELHHEHAP